MVAKHLAIDLRTPSGLNAARLALGKTVAELAAPDMFDVAERTIYKWTSGETPAPGAVRLALRMMLVKAGYRLLEPAAIPGPRAPHRENGPRRQQPRGARATGPSPKPTPSAGRLP